VTYGRAVSGMAQEIVIPENGTADPSRNEPVNPPVTVMINSGGIGVPKDIKTGRTRLTLKATKSESGDYVLGSLKEGKTIEDMKKFMKGSGLPPFNFIWYGTVAPGEKIDLNLELQDRKYVLAGPLPPEDQIPAEWQADKVIYIFNVDGR